MSKKTKPRAMTFRPQTTDGQLHQLQEATNIEQTSRIVPLIAQACFLSPSFHHLLLGTFTLSTQNSKYMD
jgi:hypothetical protein